MSTLQENDGKTLIQLAAAIGGMVAVTIILALSAYIFFGV